MLTDDEIIEIAQEHARQEGYVAAKVRQSHKYPDSIEFSYHSEDGMLKTGDGPFLVERKYGEIITLGLPWFRQGILEALHSIYSQGLREGYYKFRIKSTEEISELASLIANSKAEYCDLELDAGTIWPRWKEYDAKTAAQRLESLPCSFLISAYNMSQILPRLQALSKSEFDFTNVEEQPKYDWRPENYKPDELGPQWD